MKSLILTLVLTLSTEAFSFGLVGRSKSNSAEPCQTYPKLDTEYLNAQPSAVKDFSNQISKLEQQTYSSSKQEFTLPLSEVDRLIMKPVTDNLLSAGYKISYPSDKLIKVDFTCGTSDFLLEKKQSNTKFALTIMGSIVAFLLIFIIWGPKSGTSRSRRLGRTRNL